MRDLGSREAADRPQRQRELCVGRERGMAASEEQRESLVGLIRTAFRRGSLGLGEQRELLAIALLTADPVERVVPGGLREPSAGVRRHAPCAPFAQGLLDRLGDRFLGEVEAAEPAGERRDDAGRLLAQHAGEEAIGCRGPEPVRIRHRGIRLAHCSMWL